MNSQKKTIDKLSTRVTMAFGSINFKEFLVSSLNKEEYCRFMGEKVNTMFKEYTPCIDYYFIWHIETDTLHLHYLIRMNKAVRFSTIINYISDELKISPLAVNIDSVRGFNLCLRYMLHIDESSKLENKKVYEIKDIVSNNDESMILNLIQCDDDCEVSWETLIRAVVKYSKVSDLIKCLGLKTYHKYRSEIRDLLDEKLNSPKFLMDYSYLDTDLPF